MQKLLTLREVCEILGCTPKTVYTKVERGDLVACKIGNLRFRPSDVEDFLSKSETAKPKRKGSPKQLNGNRGVKALEKALAR